LKVKNSGLLHRGQLKLMPPTVMGFLDAHDRLKLAPAGSHPAAMIPGDGNFITSSRLPAR